LVTMFEVTIIFKPKDYFDDSWFTDEGIRRWFKEDGEVVIVKSIKRIDNPAENREHGH